MKWKCQEPETGINGGVPPPVFAGLTVEVEIEQCRADAFWQSEKTALKVLLQQSPLHAEMSLDILKRLQAAFEPLAFLAVATYGSHIKPTSISMRLQAAQGLF